MDSVVYAFHVAPDLVDDVRKTAADVRAAYPAFAQSRTELGLTGLDVWLQETPKGPVVIVALRGDLQEYFHRIRTEAGLDEWFREKIAQWVGDQGEVDRLYQFPQSEALFTWDLET